MLIALLEKLTYFNAAKDFGYGAKYYIVSYRIVTSQSVRFIMSVQGEMKRNNVLAPTDCDEMSQKTHVCRSLTEGCCGLS